MKTFLVNLDKNPERLQFMTEQLDRLGIPFERFQAVYGKELSVESKRKDVCWWRARLIKGTPLSVGQCGCALSHIGIYRKMVREDIPLALVLEDDVALHQRFAEAVNCVASVFDPNRPQVAIFSSQDDRVAENDIIRLLAKKKAICTDAYCITLSAARMIVSVNYPVVAVADSWERWRKRNGLQIFAVSPCTAMQDNKRFGTDIDSWLIAGGGAQGNGTGRAGLALLFFRIRRAGEKFLDWAIWRITGK